MTASALDPRTAPCGYCRRCAIHDDPAGCLTVAAFERDLAAGCTCPPNAAGPWDCLDCPVHGDDADAALAGEAEAERRAEDGWLHHSENRGYNDGTDGVWT